MTGLAPSGQITRRTLLLAGAGAAASAAIPEIARASQKALRHRSHLVRATWEQLVGKTLQVKDRWVAPVLVTLVSVNDVPNISKQDERFRSSSFVLLLHGPAEPALGVGVHLVKVKGAGVVEVYFSSAVQAGDGWDYVAVFANGKRRQRPPRKPRTKGSKKQRRRSGKKRAAERKPEAPKKAAPSEPAPESKPAVPSEPAPEPQAAPAETFSATGE
jgi:hypothetical protein